MFIVGIRGMHLVSRDIKYARGIRITLPTAGRFDVSKSIYLGILRCFIS